MAFVFGLALGLVLLAVFIGTSLFVNDLLLRMTPLGKLAQLYPDPSPNRATRSLRRVDSDWFRYWAWVAVRPGGIHCGGLFAVRALVPMTEIKSVVRDDGIFTARCRLDINGIDEFIWIAGARTCQQIESFWEAAKLPD